MVLEEERRVFNLQRSDQLAVAGKHRERVARGGPTTRDGVHGDSELEETEECTASLHARKAVV